MITFHATPIHEVDSDTLRYEVFPINDSGEEGLSFKCDPIDARIAAIIVSNVSPEADRAIRAEVAKTYTEVLVRGHRMDFFDALEMGVMLAADLPLEAVLSFGASMNRFVSEMDAEGIPPMDLA